MAYNVFISYYVCFKPIYLSKRQLRLGYCLFHLPIFLLVTYIPLKRYNIIIRLRMTIHPRTNVALYTEKRTKLEGFLSVNSKIRCTREPMVIGQMWTCNNEEFLLLQFNTEHCILSCWMLHDKFSTTAFVYIDGNPFSNHSAAAVHYIV